LRTYFLPDLRHELTNHDPVNMRVLSKVPRCIQYVNKSAKRTLFPLGTMWREELSIKLLLTRRWHGRLHKINNKAYGNF